MSSTIRAEEAAHFGKLAGDWWDPKGSSAMLHRLNPVRLRYIRDQLNHHWQLDEHDRRPLAGRSAADVGCGAGLLCEPLARLGADVVGIDAAPENIAAARLHAEGQGLAIDYRTGSIDVLGAEPFDLITSMEVIEHVEDPAAFLGGLAAALAPGGMLILSTPNRTPVSRLAMITLGEGLGAIPRGTHDWDRFLTPDELRVHLDAAGLEVLDVTGLAFGPARGFHLSEELGLNYLVTARAPA
ncbi:bifunctional 2-polyprenyl-6-hydroxyphenol methylase/3-demethylubiquinol 3-O-methyltransferase UbiG [Sphingomonas sp.]|jgi:2-polyprenyl-6-hydroxyphenyl methylase/3-demethylubiquinone-9 3-methyltransferase|uniref:bifunctional 2-polyprenyl-6-hydroxyphenol methylase/3-demethylubiquinol 3-O-methyltransferase UbiG n=1 Tax=Sphingomonas sp. TaxID=28214 RepID=UPI002DE608E4|nr:bifunctional 2-polyprenyl-6-hydroxyphenol methylase/3-demethylubiquinol 3-O-methyltransferase UbiG [Sphingomonas sp.]HEV2569171.1 bifunctional 2-polyprenyl-6-hydroxyphenol methylase/3-demethylubiquinol 3-O-methyltransferase UbiG [Sphingomonas sp.]